MAGPDNQTLSERFLAEARNSLLEGQHKLNVAPEDILKIAGDPVLRHEFVRRFKSEINDPDLRALIIQYIRSVRDGLEDATERTENKVDLLDRAGLGVAVSATAGAIAMTVATGGAAGAIWLLAGGIVGIGATGLGRTGLKSRSQRSKASRRKLQGLLEDLDG